MEGIEGRALPGWVEVADTSPDRDWYYGNLSPIATRASVGGLTPIAMLLLLWIPFFVIISFIGDAIAGERERHTLETLLASRMPDRAILLGKVIATVLYAWGMGVLSLLLGLVLVDLFRTQGDWMFYPLDLFVDALVLSPAS